MHKLCGAVNTLAEAAGELKEALQANETDDGDTSGVQGNHPEEQSAEGAQAMAAADLLLQASRTTLSKGAEPYHLQVQDEGAHMCHLEPKRFPPMKGCLPLTQLPALLQNMLRQDLITSVPI